MLWELFQMNQMRQSNWSAFDTHTSASAAQASVHSLQHEVRVLEQQVERLSLAAMALAELLRDKMGVSEQEIETKISEIDLRDGQLDGRIRVSIKKCPQCRQPNHFNRRLCMYCGTNLPAESFLFQSGDGSRDDQRPGDPATE